MSNPREVAAKLCEQAKEKGVRFPKVWDDAKLLQSCGAVLVSDFNVWLLLLHSLDDFSQWGRI